MNVRGRSQKRTGGRDSNESDARSNFSWDAGVLFFWRFPTQTSRLSFTAQYGARHRRARRAVDQTERKRRRPHKSLTPVPMSQLAHTRTRDRRKETQVYKHQKGSPKRTTDGPWKSGKQIREWEQKTTTTLFHSKEIGKKWERERRKRGTKLEERFISLGGWSKCRGVRFAARIGGEGRMGWGGWALYRHCSTLLIT